MDNRRSSDVLSSTSDLHIPSGLEVESARTHVPGVISAESLHERHLLSDHSHDGSVKDKLFHLKERATESMSSVQREMSGRMSTMSRKLSSRASVLRSTARNYADSIRTGATDQAGRIQMQMKSNPGKWAGIAAGAGLGLGILGRMLRHRARRSTLPHLVIIESSC